MTEQQASELLASATAIEGILGVILCIIVVCLVYKLFKVCYKFFDMFFN